MSDSWIEHSFKSSSSKTCTASTSTSTSSSTSTNNLSPFLSPSRSRFLISKSRFSKLTNSKLLVNSESKKAAKRPITIDEDDEDDRNDFIISRKNTKSKQISLSSFEPKSSADLAISKQKLAELRNWFIEQFSLQNQNSKSKVAQSSRSPFLLLNGPAGSGKTISVKVLSKEYKIDAVELPATGIYNEPDVITDNLRELSISNSIYANNEEFNENRNDKIKALHSENQFNRFQRFLYDLNRYRRTVFDSDDGHGRDDDGNQLKPTKKLLLIEDIPQIFFIKPELLHEELTLLHSRFKSRTIPIVFIISETVNGASVEQKILPKTIQTKLNFNVITFKPISVTCINKVLSRTSIGKSLSTTEIEDISLSSCGDIRTALNCLLFNYTNESRNRYTFSANNLFTKKLKLSIEKVDSKKKSKKSNRTKKNEKLDNFNEDDSSLDSSEANFNGRNEPLTLVHAMGKILYAKRSENIFQEDWDFFHKFTHISKELQRNPLNERHPEVIAERANVSCDTVADWLYENYCDFIQEEDQLDYSIDCLQVLSDVDSLFRDFEAKDTIESLRTSYLVRGSMFSLNRDSSSYRPVINVMLDKSEQRSKSSGHSFRPIRAPKQFQLNRESTDNQCKLSELKQSCFYRSSIVELNTNLVLDILPVVDNVPELWKQLQLKGLHSHLRSLIDFGGNGGFGGNNNSYQNNNRYWNNNAAPNRTINYQQYQQQTNQFEKPRSIKPSTRPQSNKNMDSNVDTSMKLTMSGYEEIDSDTIDIEDDSD